MPVIEEMSLDEIDVAMTQLRSRRRVLKKTGKVAERKIATLARRRTRLEEQIRDINMQIETLTREANIEAAAAPKRRGRRPKSVVLTT